MYQHFIPRLTNSTTPPEPPPRIRLYRNLHNTGFRCFILKEVHDSCHLANSKLNPNRIRFLAWACAFGMGWRVDNVPRKLKPASTSQQRNSVFTDKLVKRTLSEVLSSSRTACGLPVYSFLWDVVSYDRGSPWSGCSHRTAFAGPVFPPLSPLSPLSLLFFSAIWSLSGHAA